MKVTHFLKTTLPLALALSLLQSCGGPGTSNAELSISRSFVTTAGSLGAGGFIVMGESSTKKFVMTLSGSTQGKIQLDKGIWKFTAIGWDGTTPFSGNTLCGSVPSVDLSGDVATVEISVDTTACSSATLISELNVKSLAPVACDIFYTYSLPTNTFTALTSSFSPSFCSSLPNDYRSEFTKYRLQAVSSTLGEAAGFISECKDLSAPSPLNIPTSKVPLLVKFYKSDADCTVNRASQNYLFQNGILAGSPNFDQHMNSAGTFMVLSSGRTKRGKSPFMSEIPRLTCGSSGSFTDCLQEPTLSAHVNVPFFGKYFHDQIILKGVDPTITSCLPSIISSNFFSTDTCEVEDREVRIRPYRNELLCQSNPFYEVNSTIKDIYQRNGKIYVLRYVNSPTNKTFVAIYSKTGKKIADQEIGTTQYEQIAASSNGSKIILIDATNAYTINVNADGSFTGGSIHSGKGGSQVEIDPAGNYYFISTDANIKSYSFSAPGGGSMVDSKTISDNVYKMALGLNGYLYVLDTTNKNLYKGQVTSTGMINSSITTAITNFGAQSVSEMAISDLGIVYLYGAGNYYSYAGTLSAPQNISSQTTNPVGIAIVDNKVLFAEYSGIDVYNDGGNALISNFSGNCNETMTVTLGTATKNLVMESVQDLAFHGLFDDGFRMIGRTHFTNIDQPFYYFQSLSHSGGDGVRTGGMLERAQEMLGPEAIGGLLSEYGTCNDVKAAAPFTKNVTLLEEAINRTHSISLSIALTSETLNSFICHDTDPEGLGCSPSSYDFVIEFTHSDSERREKNRIKIKCGKQLGTFESAEVEISPSEIRRELLVWNTSAPEKARYENYSLTQDTKKRAEIIRLIKNDTNVLTARKIEVELEGVYKRASATQYELNANDVFTSRYDIKDTLANFELNSSWINNGSTISFDTVRSSSDFNSSASTEQAVACASRSETNLSGTSNSCYFTTLPSYQMSKGLGLSVDDLSIDNANHLMNTLPGVFELPLN